MNRVLPLSPLTYKPLVKLSLISKLSSLYLSLTNIEKKSLTLLGWWSRRCFSHRKFSTHQPRGLVRKNPYKPFLCHGVTTRLEQERRRGTLILGTEYYYTSNQPHPPLSLKGNRIRWTWRYCLWYLLYRIFVIFKWRVSKPRTLQTLVTWSYFP